MNYRFTTFANVRLLFLVAFCLSLLACFAYYGQYFFGELVVPIWLSYTKDSLFVVTVILGFLLTASLDPIIISADIEKLQSNKDSLENELTVVKRHYGILDQIIMKEDLSETDKSIQKKILDELVSTLIWSSRENDWEIAHKFVLSQKTDVRVLVVEECRRQQKDAMKRLPVDDRVNQDDQLPKYTRANIFDICVRLEKTATYEPFMRVKLP